MPHKKQNIHLDVYEQRFDDENVFSAQEAGDYVIIHDLVDEIYDQQPQPQSFNFGTFQFPHEHQTYFSINNYQEIRQNNLLTLYEMLLRQIQILDSNFKTYELRIQEYLNSWKLKCQCLNKYKEKFVQCDGKFCVYIKKQQLSLKKCSSLKKKNKRPVFPKQGFLKHLYNTQKRKKNKIIRQLRYIIIKQ